MDNTTKYPIGAILLRSCVGFATASLVAIALTALTGMILFEDLWRHGAAFTTKHALTLGALVTAGYFGDKIGTQWRKGKYPSALACIVLVSAGLAMCVFLSAGRNNAATMDKNSTARDANERRTSLKSDLAKTEKARDTAQAAVTAAEAALQVAQTEVLAACKVKAKDCGTKRRTLKGAETAVASAAGRHSVAQASYLAAWGKFETAPKEQVENAELKAGAAMWARMTFSIGSEEAIEAWLQVAVPFLQAAMLEFGLLTAVAIARGYLHDLGQHFPEWRMVRQAARREREGNPNSSDKPDSSDGSGGQTAELTEPKRPLLPQPEPRPMGKAEAEAWVVTQLALGREIPSQDDLARICGVNKSTASEWLEDWEGRSICKRTRVGRRKVIQAA